MTREDLIFETTVLAMDYYESVYLNVTNQEILKAFQEYFDLMKEEKVVDTIVMNNAAIIINTFYREENLIEPEELEAGYDMVAQLETMMEGDKQATKNMVQLYNEGAPFRNTEEIRDWLKEHWNEQ